MQTLGSLLELFVLSTAVILLGGIYLLVLSGMLRLVVSIVMRMVK